MAKDENSEKKVVDLSVEDIEAALHILSTEESTVSFERRKVISHFVWVISMGIVISACPMGLLVVWFERTLGLALLAAAVIAVVLFFITSTSATSLQDAGQELRETIENSPLGEAAKAGWGKRSLDEVVGCSVILGILLVLGGIGLLIYNLIKFREINLLSLILIGLPILAFFLLMAWDEYREYRYYSQVSRLRSQFEDRVKKGTAEKAEEVTVSSEEFEMLSKIETVQVKRKINQAINEMDEIHQEYYAVSFSPSLHKYLKTLPEEKQEMRSVLHEVSDKLQMNPNPPGTMQASDVPNGLTTNRRGYNITYIVDHDKKRVDIIAIDEPIDEEVNDAS